LAALAVALSGAILLLSPSAAAAISPSPTPSVSATATPSVLLAHVVIETAAPHTGDTVHGAADQIKLHQLQRRNRNRSAEYGSPSLDAPA
jgi:hypothetical protein